METLKEYLGTYDYRLQVKVWISDNTEHYLLVNTNPQVHIINPKTYSAQIGKVAVDFIYDPLFDEVIDLLQSSELLIKELRKDPQNAQLWQPFINIIKKLIHTEDIHPYYYLVISSIVNWNKDVCLFENGDAADDQIFVRLGQSYLALRKRIWDYLNELSEGPDRWHAMYEYFRNRPWPIIRDIVLEDVPEVCRKKNQVFDMVLHPCTPEDIWNYTIPRQLCTNMVIRKCKQCGQFFVATGSGNPQCCDRLASNGQLSCREIMLKELVREKNTNSKPHMLYNRTYKTMYSRLRSGTMSAEEFKDWNLQARMKRDCCVAGECTLEEFETWLNESRLK